MASVALIANPAAGGGRGHRRAAEAERALSALGAVRRFDTRVPGDERRCATDALESGAAFVAILGGDGTWGNAAGTIAGGALGAARGNAGPTIVLLAAGTGNDFPKSFGAPAADFDAMVRLAAAGRTRAVDVGVIDGRPFLNCAGVGFDAVVCERMLAHRQVPGRAVYIVTAVQELLGFPGITVGIDGGARRNQLMVTFSNGSWFGGSFRIAPDASVTDGRLDVVAIDSATPLRRAVLFGRAFAGRHIGAPEVRHWQATSVTLAFDQPPVYEADGEFERARAAEVQVSILPGALQVVG